MSECLQTVAFNTLKEPEKISDVATPLPMVKDAIEAFCLLGDVDKQRLQYERKYEVSFCNSVS